MAILKYRSSRVRDTVQKANATADGSIRESSKLPSGLLHPQCKGLVAAVGGLCSVGLLSLGAMQSAIAADTLTLSYKTLRLEVQVDGLEEWSETGVLPRDAAPHVPCVT